MNYGNNTSNSLCEGEDCSSVGGDGDKTPGPSNVHEGDERDSEMIGSRGGSSTPGGVDEVSDSDGNEQQETIEPIWDQTAIPSTSLVAHWKLDEAIGVTAIDSSGNNNSATLVNDPIWGLAKLGNGLFLDGINDYLAVGNEVNFDFERTGSFTASAWVKVPSSANDYMIFSKLSFGPDYQGWSFHITSPDGRLRTHLTNNYSTRNMLWKSSAATVTDNNWHHVVLTYNGTSMSSGINFYIDGSVSNGTVPFNSLSGSILNNTPLKIGIHESGASPLKGRLDDLRIYRRVLSASEVSELYREASDNFITDSVKPTGFILINNGASSTSSSAVTLNLTATDSVGVTGYFLSNSSLSPIASTSGWVDLTTVVNFQKSINYTLPSGTGPKTVYVWYRDAAGNISAPYADSIEVTSTLSQVHPKALVNAAELASIKKMVDSGLAPWKGEYDRIISKANAALNTAPQSVTFGGKIPLSGDIHDYYTDPTYLTDGVPYPDRDRYDMDAYQAFAGAVRDLGFGYAFTQDSRYAEKAISLIKVFCLDPATKMNAKITSMDAIIVFMNQGSILLHGVDLLLSYSAWPSNELAAFKAWISAMASLFKYNELKNNFGNWKVLFLMLSAVTMNDNALLQFAISEWKGLIDVQVRNDGALIHELTRTNSLLYSAYSIQPMIMGAEVARHQQVNLYDYKLNDGRSLELVLDFHAPYFVDPDNWPYRQDKVYSGENLAAYELAYLWKQKANYKAVLDRWTKPFSYLDLIQTLTHSYGTYTFDF